jgi:hypothetical protein
MTADIWPGSAWEVIRQWNDIFKKAVAGRLQHKDIADVAKMSSSGAHNPVGRRRHTACASRAPQKPDHNADGTESAAGKENVPRAPRRAAAANVGEEQGPGGPLGLGPALAGP